jgi:hypothetical protein
MGKRAEKLNLQFKVRIGYTKRERAKQREKQR